MRGILISFFSEFAQGAVERSIVVDVEDEIGYRAGSGSVQVDLAAARPALVLVVILRESCLAGSEHHGGSAQTALGRITAFDFSGATGEAGFGRLAGLLLRRGGGRGGRPQVLGRGPDHPVPRHLDLV